MLKTFVVGTLTTINSVMTPLSGSDPNTHIFPLVLAPGKALATAPGHGACTGTKASFLGLKVETEVDSFIHVTVQGQICNERDGLQPISFAIVLPGDLNDIAFLAHLPANASYVVSKVPSARGLDIPTSRVKITKRSATADGLIPVELEWLPSETGHVEHPPMTLWIVADGTETGPPWARVEFSELTSQFSKPLTVSHEISPHGHPTNIR